MSDGADGFSPGSAFYIARREWIRPISRIGRIARIGGRGRTGQTESDRADGFSSGSAFYIARREWIRPISLIGRIGRSYAGKDGAEGPFFSGDSFYIAKRCPYKWAASSGGGTGPTFRTSRTGSGDGSDSVGRGERVFFQNVNVLFAMIASEIKLVKLD